MLNKQDEKLYDRLVVKFLEVRHEHIASGRLALEAHQYAMKAIELKNAEKAVPIKKSSPSLE